MDIFVTGPLDLATEFPGETAIARSPILFGAGTLRGEKKKKEEEEEKKKRVLYLLQSLPHLESVQLLCVTSHRPTQSRASSVMDCSWMGLHAFPVPPIQSFLQIHRSMVHLLLQSMQSTSGEWLTHTRCGVITRNVSSGQVTRKTWSCPAKNKQKKGGYVLCQ